MISVAQLVQYAATNTGSDADTGQSGREHVYVQTADGVLFTVDRLEIDADGDLVVHVGGAV